MVKCVCAVKRAELTFLFFVSVRAQWEGSEKKQPRMMPVAMVERTPPPVPILAQPRPRASMDGPDT